jgi:SMC interacting uncharacterized protein involved in chromosome segregation
MGDTDKLAHEIDSLATRVDDLTKGLHTMEVRLGSLEASVKVREKLSDDRENASKTRHDELLKEVRQIRSEAVRQNEQFGELLKKQMEVNAVDRREAIKADAQVRTKQAETSQQRLVVVQSVGIEVLKFLGMAITLYLTIRYGVAPAKPEPTPSPAVVQPGTPP